MRTSVIVDTHVHVWKSGVMHPYQRGGTPLHAEPTDLAATLSDAGVSAAVIVPSSADPVSEHALAAARRLGPALGAVALITTAMSDDEIGQVIDAGYVGLRFVLSSPAAPETVLSRVRSTLARAGRTRLALSCQIRPEHGPLIRELAADWPESTFIIDHLGSPSRTASSDDLTSLLAALDAPNVSVKFSALDGFSSAPFPHRDCWPWARAVAERAGPERVIWGSNWPLSGEVASYRELVGLAATVLSLARTELDAVMGENARHAYALG